MLLMMSICVCMKPMRSRGFGSVPDSDCSSRLSTSSATLASYVLGMSSVTMIAATTVAASSDTKTQSRPRRARRNWCRFIGLPLCAARSEQAFVHVDDVVRPHLVGQVRVELLHLAVVAAAVDLQAALRAAHREPAAQGGGLHDRHVRLEAKGAGLVLLAVHVDHRRERHVDGVARLQVEVRVDIAAH